MTNNKGKPTLVTKLKMATSTATPGSTSPKLKSKEANRFPTLYDAIIYVNVGPTQQQFGIHKSLLSNHSSYFKAALEGGFEESETGVINSRDEDPKVFWVFNEWLYSGAVAHQHYATNETWSALLDLYVFAEKRIIAKFQNALIDTMIKFAMGTDSWPVTEIHLAWVNTATSSPLHSFLTQLYARDVPLDECFGQNAEKRECFDVDFVMRVVIALDEDPEGYERSLWKDRCLWHVHGPEDPYCSHHPFLTDSE